MCAAAKTDYVLYEIAPTAIDKGQELTRVGQITLSVFQTPTQVCTEYLVTDSFQTR